LFTFSVLTSIISSDESYAKCPVLLQSDKAPTLSLAYMNL
jgi:hypothetical protein